jgi:hypothetical protein
MCPVTSGNPPQTSGAFAGNYIFTDPQPALTFQVAPLPAQADSRFAQTPHPGGMLAAYLDGSVRTLAPNIDPAVYFGSMTPDGGEVISGW